MKLVPLLFILAINSCLSQKNNFELFVRSFKESKKDKNIRFDLIIQNEDLMTLSQALEFVYRGDSTQLTCVTQTYNQMTEQKGPLVKELRLPSKCLLLKMNGYYLLAYSSYDCHDPQKPQIAFLTLLTVTHNFKIIDKLVVHRDVNEDSEQTGLLNPKNGIIFTVGYLNNRKSIDAVLYQINNATFKFDKLKNSSGIKGGYYDLQKVLTKLNWQTFFNFN